MAKKTKKKSELTSAQRKVLKDASSSVNRAFVAARKKVRAAGIRPDDEGTFCFASPRGHCPGFVRPKSGGLICARPRCRHSFLRHNVF
jgi:hypothetical protein